MSEAAVHEFFQITNEEQAEWAINKIREKQQEIEKWKAWYALKLQEVKKSCGDDIDFFTSLLNDYFSSLPHKETKTTSKYDLPSAELVETKEHDDYVRDDEALLKFLQFNGEDDLINVETSVKWVDLKKRLIIKEDENGVKTVFDKTTGEAVEGVGVCRKPAEFKVRLKGEK